MIKCPSCNHTELSGALFCSNCGTRLVHIEEENTTDIRSALIEDFTGTAIPSFPTPVNCTTSSKVAIFIPDQDEVIHIEGDGEFTFGRSTQGQTIIPDIDLSPFQAYESGVSRLHANINIGDSLITIKDLGSANGTRLNGRPIDPHQEQGLNNGDILTFGRLKIQVLINQ